MRIKKPSRAVLTTAAIIGVLGIGGAGVALGGADQGPRQPAPAATVGWDDDGPWDDDRWERDDRDDVPAGIPGAPLPDDDRFDDDRDDRDDHLDDRFDDDRDDHLDDRDDHLDDHFDDDRFDDDRDDRFDDGPHDD
ncbi:ATPase [Saccharopolyspora sp. NFXS83]|uniref:ATPase n=1 Tax=Saccharopolyspora sp. NFXS83 TaxID=2993560 RepID=UPI00224A6FAF|nr:ATPase [Saccharopolyspora sp. NFXS83]MCX2728690.1 ATPase [Saccharopolyspora sp. NFXS83]